MKIERYIISALLFVCASVTANPHYFYSNFPKSQTPRSSPVPIYITNSGIQEAPSGTDCSQVMDELRKFYWEKYESKRIYLEFNNTCGFSKQNKVTYETQSILEPKSQVEIPIFQTYLSVHQDRKILGFVHHYSKVKGIFVTLNGNIGTLKTEHPLLIEPILGFKHFSFYYNYAEFMHFMFSSLGIAVTGTSQELVDLMTSLSAQSIEIVKQALEKADAVKVEIEPSGGANFILEDNHVIKRLLGEYNWRDCRTSPSQHCI